MRSTEVLGYQYDLFTFLHSKFPTWYLWRFLVTRRCIQMTITSHQTVKNTPYLILLKKLIFFNVWYWFTRVHLWFNVFFFSLWLDPGGACIYPTINCPSSQTIYPTQCPLICPTGYTLVGETRLSCQTTGRWKTIQSYCKRDNEPPTNVSELEKLYEVEKNMWLHRRIFFLLIRNHCLQQFLFCCIFSPFNNRNPISIVLRLLYLEICRFLKTRYHHLILGKSQQSMRTRTIPTRTRSNETIATASLLLETPWKRWGRSTLKLRKTRKWEKILTFYTSKKKKYCILSQCFTYL